MWRSHSLRAGRHDMLDILTGMKGVEQDWVRIKKCTCKETTATNDTNEFLLDICLNLDTDLRVLDNCQATLDWDWGWEWEIGIGMGYWNRNREYPQFQEMTVRHLQRVFIKEARETRASTMSLSVKANRKQTQNSQYRRSQYKVGLTN